MNYSKEFYEQMRKYECLFILSDQSLPLVYHLYLAENNPEKISLCTWIVKINLCYNPGTEPAGLSTCVECMHLYKEYVKDQEEAKQILPTILSRRCKPNSENVVAVKEVKITDERYPNSCKMRYRCTYCKTGISYLNTEPCPICCRSFHSFCKKNMKTEFYRLTCILIPPNSCPFCVAIFSSNKDTRESLFRTFLSA